MEIMHCFVSVTGVLLDSSFAIALCIRPSAPSSTWWSPPTSASSATTTLCLIATRGGLGLMTSSSIPSVVTPIFVLTLWVCRLPGVVGETLPLLCGLLSKASRIRMPTLAGLTASISSNLNLALLAQRLRHSSFLFVSVLAHMFNSRSGRLMNEYSAVCLSHLCMAFQRS